MTIINKALRPYFDDYDETKNYHEILFRPSVAVQTRELNQIQSMFHKQIDRFGKHLFKEGSMVIPGETNYDLELNYITVTVPDYGSIANQLTVDGIIVHSLNTGVTANVKLIAHPENGDPLSFYLEYINASSTGEVSKFQVGESVNLVDNFGALVSTATIDSLGIASKFTINNGVYFINGRFVLVQEETVLIDKYSNTPSKIVCIEYNEVVVTENEDGTLFDNAAGSANYTAPGAHRIRVDTNLSVIDLADSESIPSNMVEIFRIENGLTQQRKIGPDYNILGDVLAQRTYEESGDYTVQSFPISFDVDPTDDDKYLINLGKGLAYVNGYRIESFSTTPIQADRARERGTINNNSISANLGYYIVVEDLNILPDLTQLQEITFYDTAVVTPGIVPSGNVLGTARVRFVRAETPTSYRLYLFNVLDASGQRNTGFISDALSVYSSAGSMALSANLVESILQNTIDNSLLFPLSVEFVSTLNDELGNSDTSYSTVKQYTTTTDSNGRLTISAAPNEMFLQQDPTFAFGSFMDDGTPINVADNFSLSGTPVGTIITIDLGAVNDGRPVRVNLQVAKQGVQQKVKTPSIATVSGTVTNGRLSLNKADAFEIISVLDSGSNDITSQFQLVENKTASLYNVSYVTTSATVSNPVTVTFRYFAHSAGDYFGVDSYSSIDYEDIPVEEGVRLTDVLDFRPRINDDGTGFTGTGAIVGNIPTPFSIIRTDISHYLARKDKVYVDYKGVFGVKKGVPSLNPVLPEPPSNAMVLYELEIPPYTFDIKDIRASKINNRRYTMKDIGRLEDRISNIEYYVSLNFLEQEADAKNIIDPVTGLNRFKNGFLTDSFIDHSVGDYNWEGYHISVSDEGELRPEFSLNAVDLEINEVESTNVSIKNGIVTLPYTEVSYIKQNQRSGIINVNPYAIFRWSGNTVLTPHIDTWIDTVYVNPDVTYQSFNNGRLTQTWNSWQLTWTGGTTSSTTTSSTRSSATTTTTTTRTNIDIVADRILDTSVIPFMRSIDIRISGVGHRPRSRMHFFFDGVNVNEYVRPETNPNFNTPVVCNPDGRFEAVFRIPNNDKRRFRTGDKVLVVTDEPNNAVEFSTSYSEATFRSTGVLHTRQQTIIATRHTNTTSSTRWFDPIAQSFLVEQRGGVFVTKINTFFKSKDPQIPIQLEIREMENGNPTQRIVPGSVTVVEASDVNISDDGSVPTTFEFEYPVHLMENTEYCFVLLSNSNLYYAHIATMGELDISTNTYIVEQPYAGVMFKSQNSSTWTEDQGSDIQFEIFSAEFNTNVVGRLVLDNTDLDAIRLPVNPIQTTAGSPDIIINRRMHNYVVGGDIEISGAVGGNGISDTDLNKVHKIKAFTSPNQVVVELDVSATSTGVIGGNEVNVSNTIQASILNPNIREFNLVGTGIEYWARGTSGKSIDGTETPYSQFNYIQSLTNSEVNEVQSPWMVTNRADELSNMGGQRSLKLDVLLTSDNPNVSPVIDIEGSNIIMPFAIITYPVAEVLDGSNNYTNYRTNIAGVKNPANSLRAYYDAIRPAGTDVILSARVGNSIDELEVAPWIKLDGIVEDITGDGTTFMENEYAIENLNEFTLYQLMIQLKSQSAVQFPILKRLRVIVLGT